MRQLAAGAAVAVALAATGCGGHGRDSGLPEGASKSPGAAVAFVALKTKGDQWTQATRIAARFPALAGPLGKLARYRRALGPEVDYVWSDFANGGRDSVLLTQPKNLARVKALLAPDLATSAALGDGWYAFGDYAQQFKQQAENDKLDGDKTFKDAFRKLDESAPVRGWARGSALQSALDRALAGGGAAPQITRELGDLKAIAGFARAESDGAKLEVRGTIDPTPDPATFAPSLPKSTPGGALLYVSSTDLRAPLRALLRLVSKSRPSFETQLEQVQGALGLTLDGDVYPLLKGEASVAVYPGGRIPPILFQQKVSDEAKADNVLRRIGAIAQFGGGAKVETRQVGGTTVQKLTFESANVTVYDGVARGRVFVTNAQGLVTQAVDGPTAPLANDPQYAAARDAARAPRQVAAFAYSDLKRGLPYLFAANGSVDATTRENAKPLQNAFVYLIKDGDDLKLSGLTTIK